MLFMIYLIVDTQIFIFPRTFNPVVVVGCSSSLRPRSTYVSLYYRRRTRVWNLDVLNGYQSKDRFILTTRTRTAQLATRSSWATAGRMERLVQPHHLRPRQPTRSTYLCRHCCCCCCCCTTLVLTVWCSITSSNSIVSRICILIYHTSERSDEYLSVVSGDK